MKSLLLQHFETEKLKGFITPNTAFHEYVNNAEKSLCSWVDNKDPEDAVKLIYVLSDWLLKTNHSAKHG